MKKYTFSFFVILLALAFTSTAHASFSGTGSGGSGDPYIILTCADLQSIPDDVASGTYYKLGQDIDCTESSTYDSGNGFVPIVNFSGNFNGNNKTIDKLFINRSGSDAQGLFGSAGDGVNIHDLVMANENITGGDDVGGVLGQVNAPFSGGDYTITNVTVGGTVSGVLCVGGIVGRIESTSGDGTDLDMSLTLTGLTSSSVVTGTSDGVGGVLGYFQAWSQGGQFNLSDIHASGNVSGNGYVGGVIGYFYVDTESETTNSSYTFDELHSTGNVTGTDDCTGGVIGFFQIDEDYDVLIDINLTNFSHVGGVEGTTNVGGVAGYVNVNAYATQIVAPNFSGFVASGDVTGSDFQVGGLVGDFEFYADGSGNVILRPSFTDSSFVDGTVSSGGDDVGGLVGKVQIESGNYDHVSEMSTTLSDLHSNATVQTSGYNAGGLIGYLYEYNQTVDLFNTTLTDSYYDGALVSVGEEEAGGIVGERDLYNYASGQLTETFSGLHAEGTISATNGYAGGIIGYTYAENDDSSNDFDGLTTVNFNDSYFDGEEVSSSDGGNVGGVLGYEEIYNYSGHTFERNFSELYSTSLVTAENDDHVGGLIGYIDDENSEGSTGQMILTLADSYHNTSKVTGYDDVGGIVGGYYIYNDHFLGFKDTMSGLHSDAEVAMTDGDGYIAGIFGYYEVENYAGPATISLTDSYHETGLISSSAGYAGGIIGELDLWNVGGGSVTGTFSRLYSTSEVTTSDNRAGGIFGYFHPYNDSNTSSVNTTISDTYSTGEINADYYAGGIIGQLYEENGGYGGIMTTTLTDSYHKDGLVNGYTGDAGGIAGSVWISNDNDDGLMTTNFTKLYNTSDVTGSVDYENVGGLFAYIWNEYSALNVDTNISDSLYSGGTLTGGTYVGGISGWANDTDFTNDYASGNIVVLHTDAAYPELGPGGAGGIVGEITDTDGNSSSSISNSFGAMNITASDESTTNMGGVVGLFTNDYTVLLNNFYDYYKSGVPHCSYLTDGAQDPDDAIGECEARNVGNTEPDYFFNSTTHHPFNTNVWDFDSTWQTHATSYPTFTDVYDIVSSANAGGTINPLGLSLLESPLSQTFTITPSKGHSISSVKVDGASIGKVKTYTFTNPNADHTISVIFGSSSSGGGSSSGGSMNVETETNSNVVVPVVPVVTPSTPNPTPVPVVSTCSFTRNLHVGDIGEDVKCLQQYLNAHGFMVATSGPGSVGNETKTFGGFTKSALTKYQLSHQISPAVGFFGPITRASVMVGN